MESVKVSPAVYGDMVREISKGTFEIERTIKKVNALIALLAQVEICDCPECRGE